MTCDQIPGKIKSLVRADQYVDVIPLATSLINAGGTYTISGYFYRAAAYEAQGNLHAAISDYRQVAVIAPSLHANIYLARVLLEAGGRETEVQKLLDAAAQIWSGSTSGFG